LDDPLIAALDMCLPEPAEGRRGRFDRDEIIAMVFQILGQQRTKSSVTQARMRTKDLERKFKLRTKS
jgi:hypothetical protein